MQSKRLLYIALACFALAAIIFVVGGLFLASHFNRTMRPMMSTVNEAVGQGAGDPGRPAQSNGERIFRTAVNAQGQRIAFSGGPPWLRMRGGSCVNCHGADGRTGLAPDIRYSDLTGGEAEHGEEGGHEHERYTDASIKRAITQGVEPDGGTLSSTMPRWKMSDKDLDDLIAYLKELDQQD